MRYIKSEIEDSIKNQLASSKIIISLLATK